MNARRVLWSQLRIGVAVTLAATAAALLTFFIDDVRDAVEDRYTLRFNTLTTQALRRRTPVWLAGQPVGHVRSLRFEPPRRDTPERLVVELSIGVDAQPFITEGAVVQVTTASLLGEAVVNILPAADPAPPLKAGAELPTAAALDPSHVSRRLELLYDSVPPVTARWRQVLEQLRHGDGTLTRLARRPEELHELFVNLDEASATLDVVAGAAGGLSGILADEEVRAALQRIGPRVTRLATLWEEGSGTAGSFAADTALVNRLDRIATSVKRLSARIESGRGTLGRLLHDEALTTELRRTHELLVELKADLATLGGRGTVRQP